MKNRLIIPVIACLLFIHHAQAQDLLDKKIMLSLTKGSRKAFLTAIEVQAGVSFSYNPSAINSKKLIEIPHGERSIKVLLDYIFKDQPVGITVRGNRIILTEKDSDLRVTLSGHVQDLVSGEVLPGANVVLRGSSPTDWYGTAANLYGFYSLTVPPNAYHMKVSYVGYQSNEGTLDLTEDLTRTVELTSDATELAEVVVESASLESVPDQQVTSTNLGKDVLDIDLISSIPSLLGEVDVIKAIQLLPGVLVNGEGSSNFYVRGGSADQNLIQLDEATVYNPSHLMGFFSVFNPDAINHLQFYRGHIPASHGGRLSSLLDIRMKEGNMRKLGVSGGIGLTSSRLTVEGPIKKDRSSFIVSARRTYADLFFKLSGDEFTRQSKVYFYDLNAKFNYKINERNRIYASGYFGRDLNKILVLQYLIDWGNATGSLRWNHLFNDRLFSNTTLLYSKYDYLIDLSDETTPFTWRSSVEDVTLKDDFTFFVNPDFTLSWGLLGTYHRFKPGFSDQQTENNVPTSKALEGAVYADVEHQISPKLALNYGLRFSLFSLFGNTTVFNYDADYNILSEEATGPGIYKTYYGFEPRVSLRYLLDQNKSVKISFNRHRQYMQLLSNLSLGLNVFDVWYPASRNIEPQTADHVSAGYYQGFKSNTYELAIEAYYKRFRNLVDYVDHSTIIMNREMESELRTGTGNAYGMELSVKKHGRLNGWITYTYSRAKRSIPAINEGIAYPALYDQPHSFSVVGNYELSKRLTLSANWVFTSGRPTTLPEETFRYDQYIVPVYGAKNNGRLPNYHRLDLSLTLLPKPKPNRKNESSWVFGIYNVYNRANAASVFVSSELEDIDLVKDPTKSAFHKLYLFGIIPSITYNFKF